MGVQPMLRGGGKVNRVTIYLTLEEELEVVIKNSEPETQPPLTGEKSDPQSKLEVVIKHLPVQKENPKGSHTRTKHESTRQGGWVGKQIMQQAE